MTRLTDPAASPFTIATQLASASDTLRVRLLSMPQDRQAPSTASAGQRLPNCASPGQLSTRAPATIASMPSAMRRSKFSLKTNQASSAVNTPSALSRSDAPEAGMPARPNISRTGPTPPPANTAPNSHGPLKASRRSTPHRAKHCQSEAGAQIQEPSEQPRSDAGHQRLRQRRARTEERRHKQRRPDSGGQPTGTCRSARVRRVHAVMASSLSGPPHRPQVEP
jgi:hypothetical protein